MASKFRIFSNKTKDGRQLVQGYFENVYSKFIVNCYVKADVVDEVIPYIKECFEYEVLDDRNTYDHFQAMKIWSEAHPERENFVLYSRHHLKRELSYTHRRSEWD